MKETGHIPPQVVEIEKAVLGAVMLEKNAAYIAFKIIEPSYFYSLKHQIIAKAIKALESEGGNIDILTVVSKLRQMKTLEKAGGALYISQLTNNVASSSNLEYHCRLVHEKWIARETIAKSTNVVSRLFDNDDVFDCLDELTYGIHQITTGISDAHDLTTEQYLENLKEIVVSNEQGNVPGIATGFKKYDYYSGGHQRGNLIIYAGRPGMGKSARMVNEVYFMLNKGIKVVIHSLEMTGVEICARLLGLKMNIPNEHILKKRINIKDFEESQKWLAQMPLKIFISNKLSDIERETSIMAAMGQCEIVYVDYLQLTNAGFRNRIDNVSESSIAYKQMAKKLNVPVVALCQLSRAVETRGGDKKPMLSDLRDSGQIEQDADVVEFLYRPEYYGIDQDEDGNSMIGKIFFLNGKMRGGTPNQNIEMNWNGPLNKITEPTEDSFFAAMPVGSGFDDEVPF